MKVDLSMKKWQEVVDAILDFDQMDFPEITDGNKQSELFGIKSILTDFAFDLIEELDE